MRRLRSRPGLRHGRLALGGAFYDCADAAAVVRTSRTFGDRIAVIPEVTGSAHILGPVEFWFHPDDDLGRGFLIR